MPNFIVRVELHNTEKEHADYMRLHKAMSAAGYSTLILNNGVWRLPHAEYLGLNKGTAGSVLREVVEIASKIKPDPAVLVTQALRIAYHGLSRLTSNKPSAAAFVAAMRGKKNVLASAIQPGSVAAILKGKKS